MRNPESRKNHFTICPNCMHLVDYCSCKSCKVDPFPPIEACGGDGKSCPPTLPHAKSTFDRAYELVSASRRKAYGPAEEKFGLTRVAKVWSGILGNRDVTEREAALMMAGLKLCREAASAHGDNVDDACGYLGLLAELNALESNDATSQNPSANAFTGQD